MIDEKARRRAGFAEGVPIRLDDGQEWHFPRPLVEFRLRLGGASGMERKSAPVESAIRFGDRFWGLQAAMAEAIAGDDVRATYDAVADVAVDLIRRNYDLPDDELGSILVFRPEDPDNVESWRSIVDVALGRNAPKSGPAG